MTGYAIYDYPFGQLKIGYEDDIITLIGPVKDQTDLKGRGEKTPLTDQVFQQITEYLAGKRKTFSINYRLSGTPSKKGSGMRWKKFPTGKPAATRKLPRPSAILKRFGPLAGPTTRTQS